MQQSETDTGSSDELHPDEIEVYSITGLVNVDSDSPRILQEDADPSDVRENVRDRTVSAFTENMKVVPEGEQEAVVHAESGEQYRVHVGFTDCECADMEYREPENGCKHIRRAAVVLGIVAVPAEILYFDGVDTSAGSDARVAPFKEAVRQVVRTTPTEARVRVLADWDVRFTPMHSGSMSDVHTGDTCPGCGHAFSVPGDEAFTITGESGTVTDVAPDSVETLVFCAECFPEVEAAGYGSRNRSLTDF